MMMNLGSYYTELTSIYGENPIILQKLLREYYIEDLVYESVEKYEEKEFIINRDELTKRLRNHRWDDLKGVKSIDLSENDLSYEQTDFIRQLLPDTKIILY